MVDISHAMNLCLKITLLDQLKGQKEMKGYLTNIESDALENTNFRKVLYTSDHSQLVLMSLLPGEEIGEEMHHTNDQFFRIESGEGIFTLDGQRHLVREGDAVVVPMGASHNLINTSQHQLLKLYTIYSPPHHRDKIIRATRKEAIENESLYQGVTTE
jgi:mannose-6-phosphate isomerase-like protein (cupin superfamily)